MFKAVELPAAVADLDPGLANVDGQALPHDVSKVQKTITKCKVQGARCKVQNWVRGWCKILLVGARLVQGAPRTQD